MYTAVIDAGSSGTRLFLYKVVPGKYPVVQKISEYEFAVMPSGAKEDGLNNFVNPDNPALEREAGPQIIVPLLNAIRPILSDLGLETSAVEVNLFATAGMRFAESKYGARHIASFYKHLQECIHAEGFLVGEVRTIEGGREEGVWTWVNLNDLQYDIFRTDTEAVGIVEVGGSSAQFIYPLADLPELAADTHSVNINNKSYRVFSKSYLGLGQDDARKAMREQAGELGSCVCFPTGFRAEHDSGDIIDGVASFKLATDGAYDFDACTDFYDQIIQHLLQLNGHPKLDSFPGKFIGIDGAYYTAKYWAIQNAPQQLLSMIQEKCHDLACFESIEHSEYIQMHSANATYLNALLFGRHGLFKNNPDQIEKFIPTKTAQHTELTWTRGYLLLRHSCH